MYGYVYVIINKITNEYYIGQHKGKFDEKYWGSPGNANKLKYDFEALGQENFFRHVLSYEETPEKLSLAEEKFIGDKYKTDILCYNVSPGGNKTVKYMSEIGKIGAEKSRQVLQKIYQEKRKKKYDKYEKSPKYCVICSRKIPFEFSYRKTCSKECQCSLVSLNNSERTMSDDTKMKISQSCSKKKEKFFCISCNRQLKGKRKTGKCHDCLYKCKWSDDNIRELCRMRDDDEMTYQQIAEEFSVSHPTVMKVYKKYKYGIVI